MSRFMTGRRRPIAAEVYHGTSWGRWAMAAEAGGEEAASGVEDKRSPSGIGWFDEYFLKFIDATVHEVGAHRT